MLLATDLDGTFLAGDPEERNRLYQLIADHPEIRLVFVTGRGLEVVMPLLADPTLPTPDYLICDVGATVVEGPSLTPVQPIQSEIDVLWPGESTVAEAMAVFPLLERQEVPQQRRCSYLCAPQDVPAEIEAVTAGLGCDVLYSQGRYLDILPPGVNKGTTLARLVRQLEVDPEDVLVAGDTLNDLDMLEAGFKGVCVGESEAGLLKATRDRARIHHARRTGSCMVTSSSAMVGCTAMVRSKSSFVAPIFTAIPASWIISPAPGATIWQPRTRRVSAQTTSFIITRASRPANRVCIGRNEVS